MCYFKKMFNLSMFLNVCKLFHILDNILVKFKISSIKEQTSFCLHQGCKFYQKKTILKLVFSFSKQNMFSNNPCFLYPLPILINHLKCTPMVLIIIEFFTTTAVSLLPLIITTQSLNNRQNVTTHKNISK